MKALSRLCIAIASCWTVSPLIAQSSMHETGEFVANDPEVKAWFDKTCSRLREDLRTLADQARTYDNPEGFGIGRDTKAGKTFSAGELERRRTEAIAAIEAYARNIEPHILSLFTVWKVQKYKCLRKRIIRSPVFHIELYKDDDPNKTGYTKDIRVETKDGKKYVLEVLLYFSSRTLVNNWFAENLSHELSHVLFQQRDNEENPERIVLPPGPLNLATLKLPIHRYKRYRYVYQEFLGEGLTELRAQQAATLMNTVPAGFSYITGVGAAIMLCGLDEELLTRWYAGELTTEEFHHGLRQRLQTVLTEKGTFTDGEASRVAFGLANQLLDDRNTTAKELIPHMTAHGEYASTMKSLSRALLDAGCDIRGAMDHGGMPAHMVPTFFPQPVAAKP